MSETDGISGFLNPAQMQKLNRLVLQSRYVVEGTLAGRHRSPSRGASTEFADHRIYIPGDDIKRLDWKVLGRTERYYIRRYQDETNLRVYLVIDRSASMNYGSNGVTKFSYACQLAAALGYVVLRSRDAVGMYVYSDSLDAAMPARNSFRDFNNYLRKLQVLEPAQTTDTPGALHRIADSIQRRALVVILSDLIDDEHEVIRSLAHFRKQHHDVVVFQTLDPRELDLQFRRGGEFVDLESGERLVADPRALAEAYRDVFGAFLDRYRKACAEMNIDYRLADTSRPMDSFVRAYLEERRHMT